MPICLLVLIFIVSPFPWLLFFRGAHLEPFIVFEVWDAILQLGAASAVLVVLLEISGLILYGMATRKLSGWWSVSLPWLIILTLLSIASAIDWVGDMSRSPLWQVR